MMELDNDVAQEDIKDEEEQIESPIEEEAPKEEELPKEEAPKYKNALDELDNLSIF